MTNEVELTVEELLWANRIVAHLFETRARWALASGCIRVDARPLFGHCPITSYAGRPEWDAGDVERAARFLNMGEKPQSIIITAADNMGGGAYYWSSIPLRAAMLWAIGKEGEPA